MEILHIFQNMNIIMTKIKLKDQATLTILREEELKVTYYSVRTYERFEKH